MIINLRLIEQCNYNCSYCTMHSDKRTSFDFTLFNSCVKEIMKHEEHSIIFIYGGEPFLQNLEMLKKIIMLSKVYNLKIIFQTNLSDKSFLKIKSLLKGHNKSDTPQFFINASYHQEWDTFNNFLKKLNFLKSKNILNEIAFMDEEKNYDHYNKFKKIFKDCCNVEFCPIINGNVLYDDNVDIASDSLVSLEQKPIFSELKKDYHFRLNYYKWKNEDCNNKNNNCYISLHEIHFFNNKLYRCLNDAIYDLNSIDIGVFDFVDYKKPITCPHNRCFFDMQYFERNYLKKDTINEKTRKQT